MSYKFWVINYKETNIKREVASEFLLKWYSNNLSKLLQFRSTQINHTINWKSSEISSTTKQYDEILTIKNNATNLVRVDTYDNYSMVYTSFDTSDKTTDSIHQCIWILVTATDWEQYYNWLIHIPACQLKDMTEKDFIDQWEYIFNKYKNIIKDKWLAFTWCYYWWWLIPDSTNWLYDRHKKDYQNATTKLMLLWYQFFKEYPHRILWPKWKWEECIVIETQKNRWHIFRPDDDLTMSNQIL